MKEYPSEKNNKNIGNEGSDWGLLYDTYHEKIYDTAELEQRIHDLMEDNKKQKREAYERQQGICAHCGKHFELEEMEADHITPWAEGGVTSVENCQMLCRECNRRKGAK